MDREKLKLIVRNLELLIDSLKTEIYSDVKQPQYDTIIEYDYDEVFEE